jgi:hypothetical protein
MKFESILESYQYFRLYTIFIYKQSFDELVFNVILNRNDFPFFPNISNNSYGFLYERTEV